MTHIENILPEMVGGEVHRLLVSDADGLAAAALYDLVRKATGCRLPQPDSTPSSEVEELLALCSAVLRRHWQAPLTMLDGLSLQELVSRLMADHMLEGDATLGIPAVNGSVTEALSALLDRKITGAPEVADGMSLVRLFCDSDASASLTTLTDTTTGWTCASGTIDMLLSLYPNVSSLTMGFAHIDVVGRQISDKSQLQGNVYLPNLEDYAPTQDEGNCIIYNCPNVTGLIMPKLRSVNHYSRNAGSADYAMIGAMPNLQKVVFGKLTKFTGSWTGKANFIIDCPNLIHLEVGQGSEASMDLKYWSPTTALSDNLLQFLSNFREFICDRLADRTNKRTLTLTLSSEVYDAISTDTEYGIIDTLAAKNWTVASA